MMRAHPIREGMRVRTTDGSRLGRVVLTGLQTFQIEKGFFFPREYVARYDDVLEVQGDDVVLALRRDQLMRGVQSEGPGAAPPARPETLQPDDEGERRRLEEQLEVARQRQWAAAPAPPSGSRADSRHAGSDAEERLSSHRPMVEKDSYRLSPRAPGAWRVRHKEYAVGYSEALGETITLQSERSLDDAPPERREVEPGSDGDAGGVPRTDPGEHP
jgi:hypothetical protein